MASRTTKIRTEDWRSIEKAIRMLAGGKLGTTGSPTFRTVNVTNNINMQGSQLTGFAIERVADRAALEALDFYLARVVYVDSEGTLNLASTY